MKSPELWSPNKFILDKNNKLVASKQYVSAGSLFIANLVATIMQTEIKAKARGTLLDLGCGYAPYYLIYKDLIHTSICMDWDNTLHNNPHIDIHHDISKPLPLNAHSVNTVILSDVLEHIFNPSEILAEIFRVMATDGQLIINVPFAYWEHEEPHDYFRYTQYALQRLCENAGFTNIVIIPVGDGVGVITDVLSKIWIKKPFFKIIPLILKKLCLSRYSKNKYLLRKLPLAYVVTCQKLK